MLPPTGPPPRSSKKNPPPPSKNTNNQIEQTNNNSNQSPSKKFITPGIPAPQKNISSPASQQKSTLLPENLTANSNNIQLPSPTMAVEGFTKPLSDIVSNVNQQSYIALSRLAETMNGDEFNRHIEILDYAKNSRQMYIRLLGLVKWAQSSADHAKKCNGITTLLDNHSSHFEDTANRLFDLKSRIVTQCRLPNFAIPAAIDVLTTGKFPRLPQCIHDMTIDDENHEIEQQESESRTNAENIETLKTIDTMIKHRLVMSKIPSDMYNFKIKSGTVQFHIKQEFLLLLTLSGDDIKKDCWRCLDLQILTKDPKIPDKSLVHATQLEMLKQIIQNQLIEENKSFPLIQVYNTLHTFCMRLELEVLLAHAVTLSNVEFNNTKVQEHQQGQHFKISYWQSSFIMDMDEQADEDSIKNGAKSIETESLSYIAVRPTITISVPESNALENSTSLRICHTPHLPEFRQLSEKIDLEKIILETIAKRSRSILQKSLVRLFVVPGVNNFIDFILRGYDSFILNLS